jgi:hypothetical protein
MIPALLLRRLPYTVWRSNRIYPNKQRQRSDRQCAAIRSKSILSWLSVVWLIAIIDVHYKVDLRNHHHGAAFPEGGYLENVAIRKSFKTYFLFCMNLLSGACFVDERLGRMEDLSVHIASLMLPCLGWGRKNANHGIERG